MKRKTFTLLVACALPFLAFAQQPFNQASLGGSPRMFKVAPANENIQFMELPSVNVQQLLDEDAANEHIKGRPYRFGYDHQVNLTLENSGNWQQLENGDYVWTLGLRSPGALQMSVSFANLILPKGCKMFVMNEDHSEYHGAFDESFASADTRMLGTELLTGDAVVIELTVPQEFRSTVNVEIFRVTHSYRDVFDMARSFGQAGACMNNVRCPAYASYDNQIRSVVCLVSGGEFCSGALINNTCNDGTPYILTANHCGTSPGAWTFRFNWEASGCTNPGSSPSSNSITGGTARASSSGSDFFLCEITAANAETIIAGYNVYYAGWDRTTTAAVNPYGIHHPSGDIKKISFTTGTATSTTISFNGNPNTAMWQTPTWTDGVTEPGSSGSPLFSPAGRIIGDLSGGPSDCSCENDPSCGYDYYGRLNVSWTGGGTNSTRLSNWLDPGCNASATTWDGYDPNAIVAAFDAQVMSITSPNGSLCIGSHSPVIVIKNNGTTTLTSMTINYQIDGGAATPYSWSGSLASGATANVTMPSITIASGAHTYTASIVTGSLNGSNTDTNTGNNSQTSNYTGAGGTGASLPFTEGFQNATFPPTGWTNQNPDNNVTYAQWVRSTAAGGYGNSSASALVNQYAPSSSTVGQVDNLITPYLDLTSATNPQLTFSVANVRYSASNYDSLIVLISTNCGTNWTRLASYGNNSGANALATAADNTNSFTPTAAQWATKTIDLSSYSSQSAALINFQLKSGWGNNTYIDDINIAAVPTTPPTASYTVNDNSICAGQTVTYTNTSTGATSFSWSFPGGSPSSGTTSPVTVTYASAGTYTTTLTATNSFGTNTSTQTVTVNALPTVTSTGSYGTFCDNGGLVPLSGGSPAGGTYSGTGVSGTNFNPSTAGAGTHTITYSYTDANGCSNTATGSIVVAPCSGVEDNPLANVKLYPNPTHGLVYITGLPNEEHSFAIISTLGQVIRTGILTGDGSVDLTSLATGTYYIKIDNQYWKVIKQ